MIGSRALSPGVRAVSISSKNGQKQKNQQFNPMNQSSPNRLSGGHGFRRRSGAQGCASVQGRRNSAWMLRKCTTASAVWAYSSTGKRVPRRIGLAGPAGASCRNIDNMSMFVRPSSLLVSATEGVDCLRKNLERFHAPRANRRCAGFGFAAIFRTTVRHRSSTRGHFVR